MVKSHNLKIYIIDHKFKDKYNNSVIEVKEDYIVNSFAIPGAVNQKQVKNLRKFRYNHITGVSDL